MRRLLVSIVLSGVTTSVVSAFASGVPKASWHIERTLAIGGIGGMDYLTVDASTHRLYVPRSTHTLVIDAESGKTIGDIPGQKIAHGVALVPKLHRGFITDGGGNGSITVIDLNTNAVLGIIQAQPDADGIIYDAGTNNILVSAGDSHSLLTFKPDIDPQSEKIDPPIALDGAPEFLAADGAGHVFVNLEDKNMVAVVDLKTRNVIARWPVSPGGAPVGMAFDREHKSLIVGCRNPARMIVMSSEDGKVLSDLPIGNGVDATAIIGTEALASSGDGTLAIVRRSPAGKYELVQSLKTARGAKTLGVDSNTEKIYLPTADFESPVAGASGRPKAKPNSFKIIVISH